MRKYIHSAKSDAQVLLRESSLSNNFSLFSYFFFVNKHKIHKNLHRFRMPRNRENRPYFQII